MNSMTSGSWLCLMKSSSFSLVTSPSKLLRPSSNCGCREGCEDPGAPRASRSAPHGQPSPLLVQLQEQQGAEATCLCTKQSRGELLQRAASLQHQATATPKGGRGAFHSACTFLLGLQMRPLLGLLCPAVPLDGSRDEGHPDRQRSAGAASTRQTPVNARNPTLSLPSCSQRGKTNFHKLLQITCCFRWTSFKLPPRPTWAWNSQP